MNTDLPSIPCPLCESCNHDLRGDILDLVTNIGDNLKQAGEDLLTACETEGKAVPEFAAAIAGFHLVRSQIREILDAIPEMAAIKAARS